MLFTRVVSNGQKGGADDIMMMIGIDKIVHLNLASIDLTA